MIQPMQELGVLVDDLNNLPQVLVQLIQIHAE
jgi:hypothetical protein